MCIFNESEHTQKMSQTKQNFMRSISTGAETKDAISISWIDEGSAGVTQKSDDWFSWSMKDNLLSLLVISVCGQVALKYFCSFNFLILKIQSVNLLSLDSISINTVIVCN